MAFAGAGLGLSVIQSACKRQESCRKHTWLIGCEETKRLLRLMACNLRVPLHFTMWSVVLIHGARDLPAGRLGHRVSRRI